MAHIYKNSPKNWMIIIIRAMMLLWKDLKSEGFKFLLTNRLNQDSLE